MHWYRVILVQLPSGRSWSSQMCNWTYTRRWGILSRLGHCTLMLCLSKSLTLETGNPIRLVGGKIPSEGRLEVYYGGQWGTVCSVFFTLANGYVACRQLGYTDVQTFMTGPSFATNQTIWLSNVICGGSESSLFQCPKNVGSSGCTPLQNTWLSCGKFYKENKLPCFITALTCSSQCAN